MRRGFLAAGTVLAAATLTPTASFADGVDDRSVATEFNGAAHVLENRGGQIQLKVWQAATSNWSGWASIDGSVLSSGPAASTRPGTLDVFARGTGNDILHRYYTNGVGWSGWGSLGGCSASAPTSQTRHNGDGSVNAIDLFIRGCDGQIWFQTWAPGNGWSGWVAMGLQGSFAPSVVEASPGTFYVYALGSDSRVYQQYWNGGWWSGWAAIDGTTFGSAPTAVTQNNGNPTVIARNGNGTQANSWTGSSWTGWSALPNPHTGNRGPGAMKASNGNVTVYVKTDGSGETQATTFTGGAWTAWSALSTTPGSSARFGGANGSVDNDTEASAFANAFQGAPSDAAAKATFDGLWPGDRSYVATYLRGRIGSSETLVRDVASGQYWVTESGKRSAFVTVDAVDANGFIAANAQRVVADVLSPLTVGPSIDRDGNAAVIDPSVATPAAYEWPLVAYSVVKMGDGTPLRTLDNQAAVELDVNTYVAWNNRRPGGNMATRKGLFVRNRTTMTPATQLSRVRAVKDVKCFAVKVTWTYGQTKERNYTFSFPPSVSFSTEIGSQEFTNGYLWSCRKGDTGKPPYFDLDGFGWTKNWIKKVSVEICVADRKAEAYLKYCNSTATHFPKITT